MLDKEEKSIRRFFLFHGIIFYIENQNEKLQILNFYVILTVKTDTTKNFFTNKTYVFRRHRRW